MSFTNQQLLEQLASHHGVQYRFPDGRGRLHHAGPDILLAVLRALGLPLHSERDAQDALRESTLGNWREVLDPVYVVWQGDLPRVSIRLPEALHDQKLDLQLVHEDGPILLSRTHGRELAVAGRAEVEGEPYVELVLTDEVPLAWGYHRLQLAVAGSYHEALVLAAPSKAYQPRHRHQWGLFMPTYALQSEKGTGIGDLGAMKSLAEWQAERGAGVLGTLPLLASFLDEPFDPSPYSPASRLFWNELFLDVEALPEFRQSPELRERWAACLGSAEAQELRNAPLVDYARQVHLRRPILEHARDIAFGNGLENADGLAAYLRDAPRVSDYARFRAVTEQQRAPWQKWPQRLREGNLRDDDCQQSNYLYHLYVQWRMTQQVRSLQQKAAENGSGLYLDLALGVNGASYDAWRERNAFVHACSTGAPPDPLFTGGQDWGSPPLHPRTMRTTGYRYVIDSLRHQLQCAGLLRLDHVMALHRLYWIPSGADKSNGVYVRYPADELYAVHLLESHRHQVGLIGEDLGTVPDEVREAMAARNVDRMFVLQFEAREDPNHAVAQPPTECVASLNTHDISPFGGFLRGLDIDEQMAIGLLDEAAGHQAHQGRGRLLQALRQWLEHLGYWPENAHESTALLHGCLRHLASSDSELMLMNLEDLWLEELPQNLPGTSHERPNWRRKSKHSLEHVLNDSTIEAVLSQVHRLRNHR